MPDVVPVVDDARAFVAEAYRTRLRRRKRSVEHPIAVSEVLAADGQPAVVVAAGLLHDVLEDTDVTAGELADRFGPEVARIVTALTQDESVAGYAKRKRLLRRQTVDAGREAATVALADKLAKLIAAEERPPRRKLRHYRATLREVECAHGSSRLGDRLREQLERWPLDGAR